jgi:hypothetical protein
MSECQGFQLHNIKPCSLTTLSALIDYVSCKKSCGSSCIVEEPRGRGDKVARSEAISELDLFTGSMESGSFNPSVKSLYDWFVENMRELSPAGVKNAGYSPLS